ncbi:hypothetical protein GCM10022237_46160 [Nocardioides ginsengisoli]|uniref:AAA family ATPase n=1 Tax=Nocardioides ginsengisoli TaxID=363868 RepID=A0ABW3W856_9ACTN
MPRLSFAEPDHWPAIHQLRTTAPPCTPDALYSWIHAQHVPTRYEAQIGSALDKVMRQHTGTNECWLAVSGPSHLGKSSALTQVVLERAMTEPHAWRQRNPDGYLQTPYVYVEAASKQEARGLLAAIARVLGLPDVGNEKDLHQMLSQALPSLGVRLIVVDDAQMYRRVSDSASRLTDGIRNLLHLPVPFVFVGIDLEHSALLRDPGRNNDTVLQLQRRRIQLNLSPLRTGQERTAFDAITSLDRRMRKVVDLDLRYMDHHLIRDLLLHLDGRLGSILNTLKRAFVEAIANNKGVVTADLVRNEADSVRRDSAAQQVTA